MEGLLRNDTNIHAGIRTTLSGPSDYENDGYCGFEIVEAREIDTIGMIDAHVKKEKKKREGGILIEQELRESSRRLGTESVPTTLYISRLILILWILLVSYFLWPSKWWYILILYSRSRYRYPRDRRLDDSRTAHYCPRLGRNQPHRCRHRRSLSRIRYEC